jgi:hypothetical protein
LISVAYRHEKILFQRWDAANTLRWGNNFSHWRHVCVLLHRHSSLLARRTLSPPQLVEAAQERGEPTPYSRRLGSAHQHADPP